MSLQVKLAPQLLDVLVRSRGSKNRDVAHLALKCMDALLDRLAPGRSIKMLVVLLERKSDTARNRGKQEGGSSVAELLDSLAVQMQRLTTGSNDGKAQALVTKKVSCRKRILLFMKANIND